MASVVDESSSNKDDHAKAEDAADDAKKRTMMDQHQEDDPSSHNDDDPHDDDDDDDDDDATEKQSSSNKRPRSLSEASFSSISGRRRKKKIGRAGRRRQKRREEIMRMAHDALAQHQDQRNAKEQQQQEEGGTTSSNNNNNNNGDQILIPLDRSHALPAVVKLRQRQMMRDANHDAVGNQQDCLWKGPVDEIALLGQLGYVPGNVVAVRTRVRDIPSLHQLLMLLQEEGVGDDDKCREGEEEDAVKKKNAAADAGEVVGDAPVVIQLYPLAIRENHWGRKNKKSGRRARAKKKNRQQRNETATTRRDDGDDSHNAAKSDDNTPDSDQPASPTPSTTMLLEPFPTMFWITHPTVKALISQLEVQGHIPRYEEQLLQKKSSSESTTGDGIQMMERAHRAYHEERMALLSVEDVATIRERHWDAVLLSPPSSDAEEEPAPAPANQREQRKPNQPKQRPRGIAGIRDYEKIKCLHAHVAHYLANTHSSATANNDNTDHNTNNIVGQWAMEEVEKLIVASIDGKKNGRRPERSERKTPCDGGNNADIHI